MSSNGNGSRSRNWHHPFPQARFRNKVEVRVHDAYNQVFHGHRTAWEAEQFLRKELAGPDGIISDEALSEEARQTKPYRRWLEKQAKLEANGKRNRNGKSKKPKTKRSPTSYREAFDLVFGGERDIERCVAILKLHPWIIPGAVFWWEGNRAHIVLDYDEMKAAQESRRDVRGLVPEFK